MAHDHPQIQDAKDLAYKYRKQGVIVFHVDKKAFGFASYGMTRQQCDEMRKLGDVMYAATMKHIEES